MEDVIETVEPEVIEEKVPAETPVVETESKPEVPVE